MVTLNLKRVYTVSVNPDLAEKIEKLSKDTRKSYTEIFIEAINKYLETLK